MARSAWSWKAEHRLPSDTAATSAAVADLLEYLERHEWPQRDIFGVHMALEEALVNAIEHGNRFDPNKSVYVLYQATPRRVRIEIADEGSGFTPSEVADPTTPEHLCQEHGRGLLLMRAYMNTVKYLGCGNRLVMEKRRGATA